MALKIPSKENNFNCKLQESIFLLDVSKLDLRRLVQCTSSRNGDAGVW